MEQFDTVTGIGWTNTSVYIFPWAFNALDPKKFFRVRTDCIPTLSKPRSMPRIAPTK
jgi:hypothetical protein